MLPWRRPRTRVPKKRDEPIPTVIVRRFYYRNRRKEVASKGLCSMQRAVSYLRVSGQARVKGDRFLWQREAIARYARRQSIDVIAEFHDEGDGSSDEWANREGLAALFERVDSNDIKMVLV